MSFSNSGAAVVGVPLFLSPGIRTVPSRPDAQEREPNRSNWRHFGRMTQQRAP